MPEDQDIIPMLLFEDTPPLPYGEMGGIWIESPEVFVFFCRCSVNELIVDAIYFDVVIQVERMQILDNLFPC